jgi:hypothetical protein
MGWKICWITLSDRAFNTNEEGQTCIQWRRFVAIFNLSQLLKYNRQLSHLPGTVYGGKRRNDMISIVVLHPVLAILSRFKWSRVLGEQEIVIKR